MNVLITGGCGFIGSFAAERFHKEGHRVTIIDNLSTGQRSNVNVPHKWYGLHVEDRKCDEIFESVRPDVVLHLAAQVDVAQSIHLPQSDTQANIMGLVNMLECSRRHGVKKFIFASSAAVYGNNEEVPLREETPGDPRSPYGINKQLGEYYCEKWRELYGLQTLVFRFANVYGPRQGIAGEGGVVSIFMQRLLRGEELAIYGDGGQTRDFVYVEDVVDGLYRGAESELTGVYNLSGCRETSLNELVESLKGFSDVSGVRYEASREGDIYRSCLDNAKVKRQLDWVPLYSLDEGLRRTYEWFKAERARQAEARPARAKREFSLGGRFKRVRPYAENALAFCAVLALSLNDPGWLAQTLVDFKLVYIILLGVLYGSKQSIISAVLASGLYFFEHLQNGRDWVSLLYDPEVLFMLAIYLFFGLLVGFVSDRHRREAAEMRNDLQAERERYDFLNAVYKDTRLVKDELQRQLVGSKDSIGRIYSIVKKLETLEPEQIVTSSVDVLEHLLESRRISIYSVNGTNFLRLMIKSGGSSFLLPKTIRLSEHPWYAEVIDGKSVRVNRSLESGAPVIAAPIVHDGTVVAIVSVHDTEFERLTLGFENLFKVSVEMISDSLARAFQFVGATRSERYVDDTPVLQEASFNQVLESKTAAKRLHNADFVLLEVRADLGNLKRVADRIAETLRDSDYLGLIRDRLVLLLSNSNSEEAGFVMNRLANKGIETKLMSEEEAYV